MFHHQHPDGFAVGHQFKAGLSLGGFDGCFKQKN
jgi:hypothetical protein